MASNSSTHNVRQPQIPVFKGDSYEFWSIKMKTLFKSEDLLDFVETGCSEASNDEIRQKNNQKQDAKALFFIQQAVDESIFSKIASATSAKQAWSLLKTEYQRSAKIIAQEVRPTNPVANMDTGVGDVAITLQSLLDCVRKEKKQTNQCLPSIYMAPSTLRDRNPSSFKPRVVSIGPLHRKDENVQASEGPKATHMFNLLSRSNSTQEKTLETCVQKVNDSIDRIRSCYAETMIYTNVELTKMMVLDGCFILEFLYTIFKKEISNWGNMLLVQSTIYDLVLLENQIPFLVLEFLFECTISKFDQTVSLIQLIHPVLETVNLFKEHKLIVNTGSNSNITHHHILGLLHESYHYQDAKSSEFSSSKMHSAVELDRAGVNFKPIRDTEWPMVMEVKSRRLPCISCSWGKPTLIMPILDINDFTELVLRNLIAYEQCTVSVPQYVTSYAMAMDMLIDTQDDIAKLVESKVIVNHIGSNQEAADMMNSICKEVVWRDFFYYKQWIELDRHYNGYWSRNIAWLRRTYFNNPWNIVALLAGILLFVLTVIQTVFAVNPA